jgi:hypothetical protein
LAELLRIRNRFQFRIEASIEEDKETESRRFDGRAVSNP